MSDDREDWLRESLEALPKHINPETLVKPLLDVTGPLPAGTGLYDRNGNLVAVLGESTPAEGPVFDWTVPLRPPPGEDDPYDKVVFVQGHRHSEPVCAWPDCETYLTPEQMADLPDVGTPYPSG